MHGLNRITKIIKAASRQVSNSSNFLTWTQLKNRQLIEIRGQDSASFLQGLITNDIRHLYSNGNSSVHLNCLFSFLLQPNGRVLSDLLIYNLNGADKDQRLLAECDEHSVDLVLKTLKSHKLRRKVDIELNQKWNVFVIYPQSADATAIKEPPPLKTANTEEGFLVRDPRLSLLGFRLLATEFKNPLDVDVQESNLSSYIQHRYKLGVGEGAVDHPPGNCFPLESNADYLHGVSFHKGCYVGQELTARTFHTGVIRKRLMPLLFEEEDTARNIDLDSTLVLPGDSKRIGKMRNKEGKYGLALVNVGEAERNHFNISIKDSNIHVRTWKPSWWPKAATKDEIPSGLPEIVTHVSKKSI